MLARYLEKYRDDKNVIVMGVPKGGVEVAYQVASHLHVPLCTAIAKKLSFPQNKEFGVGAVAEDGSLHIPPSTKKFLGDDILEQIILSNTKEIERRVALYRNGQPLPDLTGRKVIIIDDGVTSGVTLVPLLKLCQKRNAEKIIIASPVANPRYDWRLDD